MPLRDNLLAHWSLDEVSGPRADDIGTSTLVDTNTVTQAVGKVGNAAQFTRANSESLTAADSTDLSTGNIDFHIGGWFYLDSFNAGAVQTLACKITSGFVGEYRLSVDTDNKVRFIIYNSGVPKGTATIAAAVNLATWYRVDAWHNSVAATVNLSLNNGTVVSSATTGTPVDTATGFALGAYANGAGFFDGRLDQWGFWKRVLTTQERTDLYNSGNGLAFSLFTGTYTLSGSATSGVATGSGSGLSFRPLCTLSGSATPEAATGSGAGLVFIPAPTHFVPLTLLARSTALTLGARP